MAEATGNSEDERILVTGARDWEFRELIEDDLRWLAGHTLTGYPALVITGGAKGADTMAREIAKEMGLETKVFPAKWEEFGKKAGPIRNQQMLDEGKPTLVLAYFKNLEKSKGTKDMVKRALKVGLPVIAREARCISEDELRSRLGVPK